MTTKGTTRGLKAFHWQVGLVYLLSQGFYLLTLAPTVLWGDDAKFQWMAYVGELRPNMYDRPLWVAMAHLFTRIPLGDIAFRVNLSASVWAAITVTLAFAVLVRTIGSLWAGATGAGALMVSHTFWSHAVRAEVYTLNTALLMISLYALLHPALNWQVLLLAGIAAGLAINNHVMM
jgi:hypothetical protein